MPWRCWSVGRTEDPLVEITLTTIAAYGSFLFAEEFHASGNHRALTAGLLIGSIGGTRVLSDEGRTACAGHGNISRSSPTASCFILIGMSVANQPLAPSRLFGPPRSVVAGTAGRVLSRSIRSRFCFASLALALAGLVSSTPCSGVGCAGLWRWRWRSPYRRSVPERRAIILAAFVVVAFSILVQGLTMPLLIKRFELGPKRPQAAGCRHA